MNELVGRGIACSLNFHMLVSMLTSRMVVFWSSECTYVFLRTMCFKLTQWIINENVLSQKKFSSAYAVAQNDF